MFGRRIMFFLMFGVVFLLNGCMGSGAPECDSTDAKKLVKEIIGDYFKERVNLYANVDKEAFDKRLKNMKFENITTEKVDKQLKTSICAGDVIIDGKKNARLKYRLSITSEEKLYAQVQFD